jgi:hypothetical protein
MPTEHTLLICDLQSLLQWRRVLCLTLRPSKLPTALVRLSEFSYLENVHLAARAAHLQKSCGCGASGLLMSATLVALLVNFFSGGATLAASASGQLAMLVGCTVCAALSGKALGLLWARWQLLMLAAQMRERIVQTSIQHVYR